MALLINKSKPAGSDAPSTLDNEQRTLRTAIQDIFGIPDNTTLLNAGMSFLAGGLATINLSAAAVTAGTVFDIAAGHAQRDLVTSVGMGMNMQADTWDINAAGNGETVAVGALAFLGIPTWTSTGTTFTVTDAATLYIQGVPVGSTNVTVTNAWALQVAAGNVKIPNSLYLTEQADADADIAGDGQIWVNTATPNELWFTDDAGTDFELVLPQATQANIEAETNEDTYLPPDLVKHSPGVAKAWCNKAQASTTINASYNIDSVGHAGTGIYTYVIGTDFSSVDYAVLGLVDRSGGAGIDNFLFVRDSAAGTFTIETTVIAGGKQDTEHYVACFGDQ